MDRKLFLTIVRYNQKFVMSEFIISGVDCISLQQLLYECCNSICTYYSGLSIQGTGWDTSICPLNGGVLNSEVSPQCHNNHEFHISCHQQHHNKGYNVIINYKCVITDIITASHLTSLKYDRISISFPGKGKARFM